MVERAPSASQQLRRWVLPATVAVGLILRASTVTVQSFWDDELFTAWQVRMGFSDMLRSVADTEVTPPLYFSLVWGWSRVVGDSEVGLRSLSVLAGTAAIPIGYLCGGELFSRRTALWTAVLVATNPFLVWYGQEARSYALVVPTAALVVLFFLRALRTDETRSLLWWAASSAACLLTHYFAVFLIAPTAVWLAVAHRRRLRPVLLAAAIPMATGAALLPLFAHQRRSISDPGAISTSALATRLAALPKNFLVGYTLPAELLLTAVTAALAGGAVLLAIKRSESTGRWMVPFGVAAATVGLPIAMAVVGVDYVTSRNLLPALVPILLVVAAGAATSRTGRLLGIGVCLTSLVIIGAVAVDPTYRRKDWRGAAEAAGSPARDRAVVFAPAFVNPGPFNTYFDRGRVVGGGDVTVSEIVVIALAVEGQFGTGVPHPPRGAAPLAPDGFELEARVNAKTFTLVRYRAAQPQHLAADDLRALMLGGLDAAVVVQGR